MNLQELEARVWHIAPKLTSAQMDAILFAALQYAHRSRGRGRLTALDEVIAAAGGRGPGCAGAPVHWQKPASVPNTAACHGKPTAARVTSERKRVTCGSCKRSAAWRKAAA